MRITRKAFLQGALSAATAWRIGPIWAGETPPSSPDGPVLAEAETVLFGASAVALAAAMTKPEKRIVIEPSLALAGEFSGALRENRLTEAKTPLARELTACLRKENLIRNGKYHMPCLTDVFCAMALEKNVNLFLNAMPVELSHANGSFLLTVHGTDGLNRIRARQIIDTTPQGWRDEGMSDVKAKYFCAPLIGKSSGILPRGETWEVREGALEGEYTFCLSLPPTTGWHEARLALYALFASQKSGPLKGFQIGGEATALGFTYKNAGIIHKVFSNGIDWRPAPCFSDLLSAVSEGESW